MGYEEVLIQYSSYFNQSDVFSNFLRSMAWGIVKILSTLCNWCEVLWNSVFHVLDFADMGSQILGDYYYFFYSILLVSVLAVGTIYLLSEKRPPVLQNLLVTAAVVFLLPTFSSACVQLLNIEQAVYIGETKVAEDTITANIVDLLYLHDNGWDDTKRNALSGSTVTYIDINETISKKTDDAFKYRIAVTDSGEIDYEKIDSSFFGLIEPLYYRYHLNFGTLMLSMLINAFVLLLASYRLFRLIWDLIYGQILVYLMSGNVASGEKTKQLLQYILHTFLAISVMMWGFYIWQLFQSWMLSSVENTVVRIILVAFAGMAMIDGPDIVERIFGIDSGASEGMMKASAAVRMARDGMALGRSAAGSAGKSAGKAVGLAGKAGDALRQAVSAKQEPDTGKMANQEQKVEEPDVAMGEKRTGNEEKEDSGAWEQAAWTEQEENMDARGAQEDGAVMESGSSQEDGMTEYHAVNGLEDEKTDRERSAVHGRSEVQADAAYPQGNRKQGVYVAGAAQVNVDSGRKQESKPENDKAKEQVSAGRDRMERKNENGVHEQPEAKAFEEESETIGQGITALQRAEGMEAEGLAEIQQEDYMENRNERQLGEQEDTQPHGMVFDESGRYTDGDGFDRDMNSDTSKHINASGLEAHEDREMGTSGSAISKDKTGKMAVKEGNKDASSESDSQPDMRKMADSQPVTASVQDGKQKEPSEVRKSIEKKQNVSGLEDWTGSAKMAVTEREKDVGKQETGRKQDEPELKNRENLVQIGKNSHRTGSVPVKSAEQKEHNHGMQKVAGKDHQEQKNIRMLGDTQDSHKKASVYEYAGVNQSQVGQNDSTPSLGKNDNNVSYGLGKQPVSAVEKSMRSVDIKASVGNMKPYGGAEADGGMVTGDEMPVSHIVGSRQGIASDWNRNALIENLNTDRKTGHEPKKEDASKGNTVQPKDSDDKQTILQKGVKKQEKMKGKWKKWK